MSTCFTKNGTEVKSAGFDRVWERNSESVEMFELCLDANLAEHTNGEDNPDERH